jgi:hypothetical protein
MEIFVKVRRCTKADSKIAAFADVTLELPEGKVELKSFSVFKPNEKPAWIAPPASKGEKRFFPFYILTGEIRKNVERAVLAECERNKDIPS